MSDNKDDIFDDVHDANELEEQKPAKKRASRKAKADPDAAPVEVKMANKTVPVDDKSDWVTIYIDEEAGESNYVPVGHNGNVYQIMRGINVKVPPCVVSILKDAVAHRVVQTVDPVTGKKDNVLRPYNAIPFRVVA